MNNTFLGDIVLIDKNKILIIGGDGRHSSLNTLLLKKGYLSKHIFEEEDSQVLKNDISKADIIILPLPVSKDNKTILCSIGGLALNLDELLDYISPFASVLGGMISEELERRLTEKNIACYDYYTDEAFVKFNAHLTAQGVLKLLLENSNDYVVSQKALVTGFGRVSKAVSFFLKGLGVDVYVAARRREQRSEAEAYGIKTLSIGDIEKTVYIFDYIVNTVEQRIFTKQSIRTLKNNALYIEVASSPFGADKDDFDIFGKKYIFAPQLPGRFYPEQSAGAILKSIEDLL